MLDNVSGSFGKPGVVPFIGGWPYFPAERSKPRPLAGALIENDTRLDLEKIDKFNLHQSARAGCTFSSSWSHCR